ncbi:gamma-glutamylcyclotransferase family protein [Streptomyces albus]|uniref:gamma-glutamylcyclotransferase family protein n=1 Tax=Streptomyces albus TaxID=1888 RepID=UPI000B2C6839|nr:gamma-glutamylcyclotransferase family protein [Streptomyces albus]
MRPEEEPPPGPWEQGDRLPVFVYGTLRPGGRHHTRLLRGRTDHEEPARLPGAALYEGPGFPYAVEEPGGEVHGHLIAPRAAEYGELLAALDALEGYTPGEPATFYERRARDVLRADGRAVRAWVYFAAEPVARELRAHGTRVPDGRWPPERVEHGGPGHG